MLYNNLIHVMVSFSHLIRHANLQAFALPADGISYMLYVLQFRVVLLLFILLSISVGRPDGSTIEYI